NLITNSVQAVSGLPPGRPRSITVATARAGGEAVLRVRDSGPGVPPQHASYLFTPFFTTKAPGQGTGLGLSLSYGLVKSHGGVLLYEQPLESGAEFRVILPLYDAPPEVPEEESSGRPLRTRRILVVDKDPVVQRLVSAVF